MAFYGFLNGLQENLYLSLSNVPPLCYSLPMSYRTWQDALEEFEEETAHFSGLVLQPREHAKHFDVSEPDDDVREALTLHMIGKETDPFPDAVVYYPYVDGLEDSLRAALNWMKSPPPRLREGLMELARGGTPADMPDIFYLYGEFKERIGVLYARDTSHVAFKSQRESGMSKNYPLKRYIASYMLAAMRQNSGGIKIGRHAYIEHAKRIVDKEEEPPKGFAASDFPFAHYWFYI